MQRVHAVEELEVDAPRCRSASYRGANTTSPIPAVIFQKIAPLYSNKGLPGEEDGQARGERGRCRVTVAVPEHEVVQASHQGEFEHLGMGAVPQDPRAEVLVVDRAETTRIGQ